MTDVTNAAPPLTLDSALAAFKAELATLTPDEQTRITYALTDLLPLIAELAEGAAHPYLAKIPLVGGMIEGVADNAINAEEAKILTMFSPPRVATMAPVEN